MVPHLDSDSASSSDFSTMDTELNSPFSPSYLLSPPPSSDSIVLHWMQDLLPGIPIPVPTDFLPIQLEEQDSTTLEEVQRAMETVLAVFLRGDNIIRQLPANASTSSDQASTHAITIIDGFQVGQELNI